MKGFPAPFSHHAWLGFDVRVPPSGRPLTFCSHGKAYAIGYVTQGHQWVRWVTRGRETTWAEPVGAVCFLPADDEQHTFVLKSDVGCKVRAVFIPREIFEAAVSTADGAVPRHWRRVLSVDDPVLRDCMARLSLAGPPGAGQGGDALRTMAHDDAAHELLRHLARLNGASPPPWEADSSTFDRRSMQHLVDYIDAHLRIPPSLDDVAAVVGLSPSHFAKKFRESTGLSLYRFINHRRVARSLEMLQHDSDPLAGLALDLGFSSQSHFTRLFHRLTGTTPA
ncbi:MAG: helix-turn-helix transcriptional regulator, partial [Planctomycetota bacterium]